MQFVRQERPSRGPSSASHARQAPERHSRSYSQGVARQSTHEPTRSARFMRLSLARGGVASSVPGQERPRSRRVRGQIAHQRRPSRDRDKNDNRRVTRARPTCPRARGGDPGHERQVIAIVRAWRPDLLEQRGVGPVVCRDRALLVVASRPVPLGECVRESRRSVSDPASSELTVRRRLHRQGDRQLNRALHVVAINRIRVDKETQTHVERRRAEGKGDKEIKRCQKRYVARQLFRQLEAERGLDGL